MPKVLTNYQYDKEKDLYILIDEGCVYADMPIAVKEKYVAYKNVLVVPIKGIATVVEKEEYLSKNKKYKLAVNGEQIVEDENGKEVYLPKDVDISKLRYINNQIVLMEEKGDE